MDENLEKAIQCYENDDLLKALHLFESLHKSNPNNMSVLQYLGDVQRLLCMVDEAFLNLKKVYDSISSEKKAFIAGRIGLLATDHRSTFEAEYWFNRAMNETNEFIDWLWYCEEKT